MSIYSESVRTLGTVLYAKKEELIATAFAVFIILIFASSIYFVESEAYPKAFRSIPDAIWWGVVTLTTVGYGDIYPITPLCRFWVFRT